MLKVSEEALDGVLKALSELSSALTKLHSTSEVIVEKAKKKSASSVGTDSNGTQDQLDGHV